MPNTVFDSEQELKALFIKANEGCNTSYKLFLSKISGYMRAYFRKRLQSNLSDVEDLVQEVLLALHNQRHTYDAQYPVTAWAHGIARYKAIDFYRSLGKAEHIDIDDAQDLLLVEDEQALDARHDIAVLLDDLPDKQRLAIILVKLEGQSIADAAHITGQSESLVKVNIHRGLKKLADILKTKS